MIRLKELRETNPKLAQRVVMRQNKGTMTKLVDTEGYVCCSKEELENWKPRKAGRPVKEN